MKKCPRCGAGKLSEVRDIVHDISGYLFVVSGQRCPLCQEEFVHEREIQPVIKIAQRLGIWGPPLKLHRKLSKSARGTVLRIPTDIERAMSLKGDEEITITKIGKKIVIEIDTV